MLIPFKTFFKGYLTEGGAGGHMSHPWDEMSLSFAQLKDLIHMSLTGGIQQATIKFDGQNLFGTYTKGKFVFAHNATQTKNFGANGLSPEEIGEEFAGKPDLQEGFKQAAHDMSVAISKIPNKDSIFKNGKQWVNFEILYSKNKNVIPYGETNRLIIHSVVNIDAEGNQLSKDVNAAKKLIAAIKASGGHVQNTYKEIRGPMDVKVNPVKNAQQLESELMGDLENLMADHKMKPTNTLHDYKSNFFQNKIAQFGITDPNDAKVLLDRWMDNAKNASTWNAIKKKYPSIYPTLQAYEGKGTTKGERLSRDHKALQEPLEVIFLKLGAAAIKSLSTYSRSSEEMDSAKKEIIADMEKVMAEVKATGDENDKKKLAYELQRLENIGGLDAFMPEEGIVFPYNGNFIKLTGAFPAVNKILGILKFKYGTKKKEE